MSVKLSAEEIAWLDWRVERSGGTRSDVIRKVIDRAIEGTPMPK